MGGRMSSPNKPRYDFGAQSNQQARASFTMPQHMQQNQQQLMNPQMNNFVTLMKKIALQRFFKNL